MRSAEWLKWGLAVSMALGLHRVSTAAAALQVDSVKVPPGQEVLLTLSLNAEAQGVCGLMVTLQYGTKTPETAPSLTLLNPGESRLGPAFSGALYGSASPRDPDTGLVLDGQRRIAIVHGDPVDGPALVITLPFQVPSDAPSGSVYSVVASVAANDWEGRKIEVEPGAGTITVEKSELKLGDINGNGRVEVSDVILILRASLDLVTFTPEQKLRADFTRNGRVDVGDAVAALRAAVGLV